MRPGRRVRPVGKRRFQPPSFFAQNPGVLGNDDGQLEAGVSALEALGQVPGVEVADAGNGTISVTWWVLGSSQRSWAVAMRPSALGWMVTSG